MAEIVSISNPAAVPGPEPDYRQICSDAETPLRELANLAHLLGGRVSRSAPRLGASQQVHCVHLLRSQAGSPQR